jgi:hypothetical protein
MHEQQFLRRLRDAGIGEQPLRATGFAGAGSRVRTAPGRRPASGGWPGASRRPT